MSGKDNIHKIKGAGKMEMPLDKENYFLLIIAFVIVVIGFILMTGGSVDDPAAFNEEIFSFRRIKLAPVVTLFGFVFAVYAIMKKPEVDKNKNKK